MWHMFCKQVLWADKQENDHWTASIAFGISVPYWLIPVFLIRTKSSVHHIRVKVGIRICTANPMNQYLTQCSMFENSHTSIYECSSEGKGARILESNVPVRDPDSDVRGCKHPCLLCWTHQPQNRSSCWAMLWPYSCADGCHLHFIPPLEGCVGMSTASGPLDLLQRYSLQENIQKAQHKLQSHRHH